MSTPIMLFTQYMKWVLMGFWVLWGTTFCVSRLFIFHEAYTAHVAMVSDEKWLSDQCNTPEFYSNIRQHTDLCEAVYANSRSNVFLVALNAMAVNTHACGNSSCVDVIRGVLTKLGWPALGIIIILFLFAPNLLVLIYQTICGRSLSIHERAMFKQTERYGLQFEDLQASMDIETMPEICGLRNRSLTSHGAKMV
jgi:hypothetical protein